MHVYMCLPRALTCWAKSLQSWIRQMFWDTESELLLMGVWAEVVTAFSDPLWINHMIHVTIHSSYICKPSIKSYWIHLYLTYNNSTCDFSWSYHEEEESEAKHIAKYILLGYKANWCLYRCTKKCRTGISVVNGGNVSMYKIGCFVYTLDKYQRLLLS